MATYHPKVELATGYAGLYHTAEEISMYIKEYKIFVEPFAGLGRVGEKVYSETKIFNDRSEYAVSKLKSIFPNSIITDSDFKDCILRWDSIDTFFLIDPPWRTPIYKLDKYFLDRSPKQYYEDVMKLLPNLKGDWFLCSSFAERGLNKILSRSGYPMLDIKSKKTIFGKHATVKIISNKPFIKHQPTLFNFQQNQRGKV